MRFRIFALCLLALCSGCDRRPDPALQERVEPTADDRTILRLEGIDPYSPRGQQRIRKSARDRAELDKLLRQRQDQREPSEDTQS